MLGCQDFCGYYDWTFRDVAREHGRAAVERLWADAVGGESQEHYLRAALADGLRGLYRTWVKTGEEESCDWTFTLDEARNVLRWDMRRCPSKGFLLANDLNAHDDYCDHCMGWIVPLLARAGVEVTAHEHNHCGQCWAEMNVRGKPYETLKVPRDVRDDPNWRHGYLDRWRDGAKVPAAEAGRREPDVASELADALRKPGGATVLSGAAYAGGGGAADAVLIDAPPRDLERLAARYLATPQPRRPVLLYSYPPSLPPVDFSVYGLPRPLPVLPLLIERGAYRHRPHAPPPETSELIALMVSALSNPGPGREEGTP